jgi:hypothetical protein
MASGFVVREPGTVRNLLESNLGAPFRRPANRLPFIRRLPARARSAGASLERMRLVQRTVTGCLGAILGGGWFACQVGGFTAKTQTQG